MKKRLLICLLALAALCLFACDGEGTDETTMTASPIDTPPLEYPWDTEPGETEPSVTEAPLDTQPSLTEPPVTEEPPAEPGEADVPVVEMISDRMDYQAGDGTVVLEYSAGYPLLRGTTEEATAKLNDAVLAQLEVLSHEAAMLADSALLHYEMSSESFMLSYSFLVYCDAFLQGECLSLVFRVTEYEGGPDGRERYSVMRLDRRTGEEIPAEEDEEAFWADVMAGTEAALERTSLELFEDWRELLGTYVKDCYYFRDGYMVILFGEYTVAPGISGVVKVELDMAEIAVHMNGDILGDLLM